MRSWLFSFGCFAVLSVAACGAKTSSTPSESQPSPGKNAPAKTAENTTTDVVLLEPTTHFQFLESSRPLGRVLRFSASTMGDLFVLDSDNHRVLRYDLDGRLVGEVGGSGTGKNQFSSPVDLDADGQTVWVLDRQNRRLVRLNAVLNYVEEIPLEPATGDLSAPLWYDGVSAAANGDVFLLDKRAPQAVRISAGGEILATYGGFGTGNGRLEAPVDLDAAQDGSLFVVDGSRLLLYDRSGNLERVVRHSEPLAHVEAGGQDAWITTAYGELLWYHDGTLQRVISSGTLPRVVDLTISAAKDPILLEAGWSVWLCHVTSD